MAYDSGVMRSGSNRKNSVSSQPSIKSKQVEKRLLPGNNLSILENDFSEIFTTEDHSRFTRVEGNRKISEEHVRQLMKEIKDSGGYFKHKPIFVFRNKEGKLGVLDGQHRLEACKRLQAPISYCIVPEGKAVKIMKMANCQKNWKRSDWMNLHSWPGSVDFKIDYYDLRLFAEAGGISSATILALCSDIVEENPRFAANYTGKLADIIYKGDFTFPVGMREVMEEKIILIKDIKKFLSEDLKKAEMLNRALVQTIHQAGYNHKRMLIALERRAGDLQRSLNLKVYVQKITSIYNHHLPKGQHLHVEKYKL